MKTYKSLLTTVMLLAMTGNILAQDVKWDKEKYPDYNPTPHVDQAQLTRMKKRLQLQAAQGKQRPDHWNNALSTAFPPVMNQSAGPCGSASRIYYMFAQPAGPMVPRPRTSILPTSHGCSRGQAITVTPKARR